MPKWTNPHSQDDPAFEEWLRHYRVYLYRQAMADVARAGADYLAELDRTDRAHKARLQQRAESLEATIADYNECKRSISTYTADEVARFRKTFERMNGQLPDFDWH